MRREKRYLWLLIEPNTGKNKTNESSPPIKHKHDRRRKNRYNYVSI